jgi:hypothetical protein
MFPYENNCQNQNGGYNPFGNTPDTRKYTLPASEYDGSINPSASVPATATFSLRQRDTIDFTFDASVWLAANGNPTLDSAVWTIAGSSPKTPTIAAQNFSPSGQCVVVVTPASGAAPGDAYWLDLTLSIAATPATTTAAAIPARTLVRRIYIIVTAG